MRKAAYLFPFIVNLAVGCAPRTMVHGMHPTKLDAALRALWHGAFNKEFPHA